MVDKNSRTTKSIKNIVISFISYFFAFLLNYVGRIIFVRFLDASYLGINGLFSNIISILSIADLGIATALTYSLYKPLKEHDEAKIASLISYFRKVYLIIALAVLVFGLVLIPLLPYVVNLENTPDDIYIYYILFVLESASSYLFVYKSTLLTADQKNYLVNYADIGLNLTKFIARIIILVTTKNYVFYVGSGVLLNIIFNFIKNYISNREYPFLHGRTNSLTKSEKKEVFSNVKATFLYKIGGVIQQNTDSILISIFVGTVLVGYYSNYILIINGVISIITVIFNAVKASLGNYLAEKSKDTEQMYKLYLTMDLVNYRIIAFCSIAFVCLFEDFTTLSYGQEYLLGIFPVIIMVLNFYTSNIRQTLWAYRETTGIFVKTRHITLVTSVLNLILSILFGYFFGLNGILIATVVARFCFAFWKEPLILFNDIFHKSPRFYFLNYLKQIVLLFLIGAITYACCYFINLDNLFVTFIIKIIIVIFVPNILLLLCFFRNESFVLFFKKIKQSIFKK